MSLWDDMGVNHRASVDVDVDLDAENAVSYEKPLNTKTNNNNTNHKPNGNADEGSAKRALACNPCRERKVRCDREQPTCGRCVRRGHGCTYSGPSKQSITKLDLSRLLLNLQERLSYAESQGVFRQPPPTASPQANDSHIAWSELGNLGLLPPSVSPAVETTLGLEFWQSIPAPTPMNAHPPTMSGSMLSSATTSITPTTIDWSHMDTGSTTLDDFASSLESPVPELSSVPALVPPRQSTSALIKMLHNAYFDVFDSIMPIINRERFEAELVQAPGSLQVQALSQAMATLGALVAPELGYTADTSYAQTRTLLEMCEREENGANLNCINTLHACVLLGFYELKQPNFARAWLTLGRGIRLGKILGFMSPQSQSASPVPDAQDAEERRRTMWQLYILDAFAVMRTEWDPAFEEMAIPLPCPGSLADVTDASVMPTIQEAFESADTHTISTFGGTACVISMYRRCFNHIYASQQDPSYAFWDNYYRIDKLVSKCRACFLAQHAEPISFSKTDPLSFVLFMNLAAVEVSLHKTAINKAEREHLNRSSLATEAEARCLEASNDITEALRACRGLARHDLNVFRQASALFTWATTLAAQAHLWMLGHGRGSRTTHVANLHVLAGIMREYIGAEHVRPGLLEQIDTALAPDRARDAAAAAAAAAGSGGNKLPAKRPGHNSPTGGNSRNTRA